MDFQLESFLLGIAVGFGLFGPMAWWLYSMRETEDEKRARKARSRE